MKIGRITFGETKTGEKIDAFTVSNSNGLEMTVINYGATLQSFKMPGKSGTADELTLGFDTLKEYEGNHPYFGAVIGRVANRISEGKFTINGREFLLDCNDNKNHIHGGIEGFSRKVWSADSFIDNKEAGVKLFLISPDGDQGYPGKLDVSFTISLDENNNLKFNYEAVTTKPTIVNLTNHAYWNLSGAGKGNIYSQKLYIRSSMYVETDDELIPTGNTPSVHGTPFDFLTPKSIGQDIDKTGGYDHCFVLDNSSVLDSEKVMIEVFDPESSRKMKVYTNSPGVQFYTGNFLDNQKDRSGNLSKHDAFCLETEEFPDAVNHTGFPSAVLEPGETYSRFTKMNFSLL